MANENVIHTYSDNPTTQLVPFKMDGNNWSVWNAQFVIAVESKNKEKFLTGEIAKSEQTNIKEHKKWKATDALLRS